MYSAPTHSATTFYTPLLCLHPWTLLHSLPSNRSCLYYCIYLNRTPPHTLILSPSVNVIKNMTEGENIVAWTPCPRPPHTHTFLLAQQNTHTKSLKGLNYYRHAHILEHTQTKAGRHTQSLSLMATGWR